MSNDLNLRAITIEDCRGDQHTIYFPKTISFLDMESVLADFIVVDQREVKAAIKADPWVDADVNGLTPKDQMIDVMFRSGRIVRNVHPSKIDWLKLGGNSDVVKWKLAGTW